MPANPAPPRPSAETCRGLLLDIVEKLCPTASKAVLKPICWVGGGYGDVSIDYCPDCIDKIVFDLNTANPDNEHFADGGDEMYRNSDTTACCANCGCDLGYSLSNFGLSQEIDHWIVSLPVAPLQPIDAFNVQAILRAAQWCQASDLLADAIKIGEAALIAQETEHA